MRNCSNTREEGVLLTTSGKDARASLLSNDDKAERRASATLQRPTKGFKHLSRAIAIVLGDILEEME